MMRTVLFLALVVLGIASYAAIFRPTTIVQESEPGVKERSVEELKTQLSDDTNVKTAPRPTRVSSASTI